MRLRSSFDVAIALTPQQAHGFLDADLLGGETIKYHTPINPAIILRRTPQRGHNLIQSAACCIISNIKIGSQLLDIAPILDQQFDKIHLLARQATNPAQAKLPLDHDTALRTFQPGNNQLIATYWVPCNKWMHAYAPPTHPCSFKN